MTGSGALDYDRRRRVVISVAEADPDGGNAALGSELLRSAFEDHERLPACVSMHIDVAPAHRLPNAGAECFRDCFLGRKARGKMPRRELHRLAIRDLARREHAMEEAFAEALERVLDACVLDDIETDAKDAHVQEEEMNLESRKPQRP